jgi:multicomponent Na+:H+ antiporter subunit D
MSGELHILAALALPLAGAIAISVAGRHPNVRETITLVTSTLLAVIVWSLWPEIQAGSRPELVIAEMLPGVGVSFRIEPLGMMFAALASGLWVLTSIYSIGYMRGNQEPHQTRFYACFAIALAATMGVAFSGNLLTLFLCYEILTLSTYPLVAHHGDQKSVAAGRVYLALLLAPSIGLFLPALIWTYTIAGTLEFAEGGILAGRIDGLATGVLLAMFVFGIGKAAVMPFHRWLPAAMVAPTPVSALLHAVAVVKTGVFTVTKLIVYVFGADTLPLQPTTGWLLWATAFTVIAASVIALRQTNLKRLLAYSTVGQLSFVIMAAVVLAPLSSVGTALHLVAHSLGKISLFFAAGAIYTASKKTEIGQLDGIGRRMPFTMAAFTIGALTMIGLPPTGGFVSKWYLLSGSIVGGNQLAIAVVVGSTLLSAAYFLPILHRAWFRPEPPPTGKHRDHGEAPLSSVAALTITALLAVAFFFYHGPLSALESQLYVGTSGTGFAGGMETKP